MIGSASAPRPRRPQSRQWLANKHTKSSCQSQTRTVDTMIMSYHQSGYHYLEHVKINPPSDTTSNDTNNSCTSTYLDGLKYASNRKFELIASQLTHLIEGPDGHGHLGCPQSADGRPEPSSRCRSRVRTMLKIYLKLISISPLELYFKDSLTQARSQARKFAYLNQNLNHGQESGLSASDINNHLDTPLTVVELNLCREQVLSHIENLNGYSNCIHMLRVILKSPTMVSVINAYQDLLNLLDSKVNHPD